MPAPNDTHIPGDEFDFLRWIRRQVPPAPAVPIGIGDDCAALALRPGTQTLLTTDMLIDGVHFRLKETEPRRIGHKAVARCLSDIAAMAGDAVAVVAALAAPKHISMSALQEIVKGMIAAANDFGAPLAGGDFATGDLPLTLTLTGIGTGTNGKIPRRCDAQVNDVLLVTGELGGSLLGRHLDFTPRLAEAAWLRDNLTLHAMIDISDGLAADANHIAVESGVGIELWAEAIPVSNDAILMAERSGQSALQHALHDGEDYELLFTLAARDAEQLLHRQDLPVRITCIGDIVPAPGLELGKRGEKPQPLQPQGWRHRLDGKNEK